MSKCRKNDIALVVGFSVLIVLFSIGVLAFLWGWH